MVLDIIILVLMVLSHSQIKTRKQHTKKKRNCLPKYTRDRSELNVRTYVDIHWQMAFCNLSLSIFHWSFHRFMFTFTLCVVRRMVIYFHKNHWHHCYIYMECIPLNMPYYITRKINVFWAVVVLYALDSGHTPLVLYILFVFI